MLLLAIHMTGLQTPSDGEAPPEDDNCTAEAEGEGGGAEATSAALPMFALALYMTSFSLGMGPGVRKLLHSAFVLLLDLEDEAVDLAGDAGGCPLFLGR